MWRKVRELYGDFRQTNTCYSGCLGYYLPVKHKSCNWNIIFFYFIFFIFIFIQHWTAIRYFYTILHPVFLHTTDDTFAIFFHDTYALLHIKTPCSTENILTRNNHLLYMIHNRQLGMRRIPALLGDAKLSRIASHKDSRISPFSARGIKHVLNHS